MFIWHTSFNFMGPGFKSDLIVDNDEMVKWCCGHWTGFVNTVAHTTQYKHLHHNIHYHQNNHCHKKNLQQNYQCHHHRQMIILIIIVIMAIMIIMIRVMLVTWLSKVGCKTASGTWRRRGAELPYIFIIMIIIITIHCHHHHHHTLPSSSSSATSSLSGMKCTWLKKQQFLGNAPKEKKSYWKTSLI